MSAETATGKAARTRVYRNGRLENENFPIDDVSDYLSDPGAFVWVDLRGPQVKDLDRVAQELGVHALAIEDALEARQRPKLDRYADHQYLNVYGVAFDKATGQLQLHELGAFITESVLVTVRKDEAFDIDEVVARWDGSTDLAKYGVGFLLYGLLDHVVDGHFDSVQALDEEIEALEDLLFASSGQDTDLQRRSFTLRKSLVTLRRVVLPMREVVNTLLRRHIDIVTEEMAPYFQDVYDHVLRATEWTESLRDMVNTILETNLTIQGNRLNVISKKVTSWAAIIAVPTAITGFYGQNLPYPGFATVSGFIWSSSLIVGVSSGLYVTFKRKGWL